MVPRSALTGAMAPQRGQPVDEQHEADAQAQGERRELGETVDRRGVRARIVGPFQQSNC